MKKFLHYFATLLLGCLALASCSTEGKNETVTVQTFNNAFVHVNDIEGGTAAYYGNIRYEVRINYTQPSADITIAGLKLTDGTSFPQFVIQGLKVAIDSKGWLEITGENITPRISGVSSVPVIGKIRMRIYQRYIETDYLPAFSLSMSLDNKYSIVSSYVNQYCYGSTICSSDKGLRFETKNTTYKLSFNIETRCVTVTLNKAQFMAQMPAMDMVFKNIPFTLQGSKAVFSIDKLIPELGNTPAAGFPITDLEGSLDFGGDFKFGFTCTPATMGGMAFDVEVAKGGFPPVVMEE
ncbi:MAG: hypothetical protein J6C95_07745 [Muribaculaceae bacterium]|nr:hypothetical protein [Muribaculaceae bacterium]